MHDLLAQFHRVYVIYIFFSSLLPCSFLFIPFCFYPLYQCVKYCHRCFFLPAIIPFSWNYWLFSKEQRPHQMKGKCSSHPLSTWCDHTNCKSLYSFKFYAVLMKCHVISSKIDFLNVISIPGYLGSLPFAFSFRLRTSMKYFCPNQGAIRFDVSVECANNQTSMEANNIILMRISEGWNNLGFIIVFRLNDLDFCFFRQKFKYLLNIDDKMKWRKKNLTFINI